MSVSLVNERWFRLPNVIDNYNRESLDIKIDTSLLTLRVIRVLDRLMECRGNPESIHIVNGPEFIIEKLKVWCKVRDIHLFFIEPGKPVQNVFIEWKMVQ